MTNQTTIERAEQIETLLRKIVQRAHRPVKAGSTDHMLQAVPAALIEEARVLLEMPS